MVVPSFRSAVGSAVAGALAVPLLAALAGPAAAQSTMADLAKAEAVVEDIWRDLPLSFRRVLFIEPGSANGYGVFVARDDNVFAPGETLVAYAEPVGYGYRAVEGGRYTFGFDVDFFVKRPDGTILAGQENFDRLSLTSHERVREFQITLRLTVRGLAPGSYEVVFRTRDIASEKQATMTLPFEIAE